MPFYGWVGLRCFDLLHACSPNLCFSSGQNITVLAFYILNRFLIYSTSNTSTWRQLSPLSIVSRWFEVCEITFYETIYLWEWYLRGVYNFQRGCAMFGCQGKYLSTVSWQGYLRLSKVYGISRPVSLMLPCHLPIVSRSCLLFLAPDVIPKYILMTTRQNSTTDNMHLMCASCMYCLGLACPRNCHQLEFKTKKMTLCSGLISTPVRYQDFISLLQAAS